MSIPNCVILLTTLVPWIHERMNWKRFVKSHHHFFCTFFKLMCVTESNIIEYIRDYTITIQSSIHSHCKWTYKSIYHFWSIDRTTISNIIIIHLDWENYHLFNGHAYSMLLLLKWSIRIKKVLLFSLKPSKSSSYDDDEQKRTKDIFPVQFFSIFLHFIFHWGRVTSLFSFIHSLHREQEEEPKLN